MKNTILEELVGTWEVVAETQEDAKPGRRETLRECADTLRMLLSSEGLNAREQEMEDLLRSACAIADRKGAGTAWERFGNSIRHIGLNGVTARTYRILPSDVEGEASTSDQEQPMTTPTTQREADERAAFEAWYSPKFGVPKRLGDSDQYQMSSAQGAWQAWQAARASVTPTAPQAASQQAELTEREAELLRVLRQVTDAESDGGTHEALLAACKLIDRYDGVVFPAPEAASQQYETCGACGGTGYYASGSTDLCEDCKGDGEVQITGREWR